MLWTTRSKGNGNRRALTSQPIGDFLCLASSSISNQSLLTTSALNLNHQTVFSETLKSDCTFFALAQFPSLVSLNIVSFTDRPANDSFRSLSSASCVRRSLIFSSSDLTSNVLSFES